MFCRSSPQQQTEASDLSLVRGGARLTAAQHGSLQGAIRDAYYPNNTDCLSALTQAAEKDETETRLTFYIFVRLFIFSNDIKICCYTTGSVNFSAFTKDTRTPVNPGTLQ